jgi:hypothetical protein
MLDGSVSKFLGYSSVTTPSGIPYFVLPMVYQSTPHILYASLGNVFDYNTGVSTDISKLGGYSATENIGWNGGILNGVAILNNGVDNPQMWVTPPNTATKLADLSNWPASTKCRVMRPFKNYLFALDVTESSTRYQRMVRWSHPADPGSVPSSWSYTDETKDAGRVELSETDGACIDCLPLGDVNVIYKEDSTWGAQFIGPPFIFRFYAISKASGILNRHCAQPFSGRHFVVTNGDVIVHSGGEPQSILDAKMRRNLFANMDATYYVRAFVARNPAYDEMMFFYPESGSQWPNKILVWNVKTGAVSLRDAATDTFFANFGVLGVGSTYAPSAQRVIVGHTGPKLSVLDNTNQNDGSNMTAYVERRAISIPETDQEIIKFLRRIYIRATGTGTMNVYAAGTFNAGETPSYGTASTFTIGTDQWVDVTVSGRFLNIKFESTGDQEWRIDGYDLDVEQAGMR